MKLSFCIPTHDGRRDYLQEAIESVLSQVPLQLMPFVEFSVSDNASQDGTQELIREYQRRYPGSFIYKYNSLNVGGMPNLYQSIQIATGDFCWMLSSDDRLCSGSVQTIFDTLRQYPDASGITVNGIMMDREMTYEIVTHPKVFFPEEREYLHVYTDPEEIVLQCGIMQGAFSLQIFRRNLWLEVVAEEGYKKLDFFRHFQYVYVFGKMVKRRPKWIWHPEVMVQARTGNSSLEEHLADFSLYHVQTMEDGVKLMSALLGKNSSKYLQVIQKGYFVCSSPRLFETHIWSFKASPSHTFRSDRRLLQAYVRHLRLLPGFYWKCLPFLLIPHIFVKTLSKARIKLALGTRLQGKKQTAKPEKE